MKAKIEFIETTGGGMSCSSNKWDDYPVWSYWDAYLVDVRVKGHLAWGPLKYRSTAKKSHSGIAEVEAFFFKFFDRGSSKELAEEFAIKTAIALQAKGFEVELSFSKDKSLLKRKEEIIWINNPPSVGFQKKVHPSIEGLIP